MAARKAWRTHAYTQANTRQILMYSSDSSDRLLRDQSQARSGWIRAGVQTSGWLMKRRGVHGERLRADMTARSRAASSRHIARTSCHTTASSHDAGTRSAAWAAHTHRGYSFPCRRSFVPLGLGPARGGPGLVEALVKVTGPQSKPRTLNLRR